jgi:hypothetical protein
MFFHDLFLLIFLLGLIAATAALVCLLRAREYYLEPHERSLLSRGLAKFFPSNYRTEGAALVRLGLLSLVLCAYAWIPGGVIHFTRFGTPW